MERLISTWSLVSVERMSLRCGSGIGIIRVRVNPAERDEAFALLQRFRRREGLLHFIADVLCEI